MNNKNDIRDVGSTADFCCFSLILNTPGTPGICVFGCQTLGNIVFEVLVPLPFQKYNTLRKIEIFLQKQKMSYFDVFNTVKTC